jgi:pimeloyl-ACP methyl ester carboxylesterase
VEKVDRVNSMTKTINTNPKIARLYKDIPEASLNQLQEFRDRYPYQEITLDGRTWRYIDTKVGEQVLFIPAGGTTIAEVSFNSLAHFAQRYRVIAPDYPSIGEIQELCDGIIALLDHLDVDEFFTMGGSYGGWMVQSLVRLYPERICKLVITAVGPPDPKNSQELARLIGWLRITPTFMLKRMINRSFSRLASKTGEDEDLALLGALVREAIYFRLGREDILAMIQRLIDQTENYTYSAQDLEEWPGEILLVFGSEDPATPLARREAMTELYPIAESKIFEGGEHGIAITHQQEYFAVIDEFLAG